MYSFNAQFYKKILNSLFFISSMFFLCACDNSSSKDEINNEEGPKFPEVLWNVKAIHPDGQTLAIKAFDATGKQFDIKAIQDSDQDSFLDVKALGNGKNLL